MDRLSIEEAAARLGVSMVTIRRRVRRGELAAEKEDTPSGFRYVVLLPSREELGGRGEDVPEPQPASAPPVSMVVIEETLRTLREELERRSEENRRLQELLAREQATVQALIAQRQLPASTEERTPEDAPSVRSDQADDQRDRGLLSRLISRLRGA